MLKFAHKKLREAGTMSRSVARLDKSLGRNKVPLIVLKELATPSQPEYALTDATAVNDASDDTIAR